MAEIVHIYVNVVIDSLQPHKLTSAIVTTHIEASEPAGKEWLRAYEPLARSLACPWNWQGTGDGGKLGFRLRDGKGKPHSDMGTPRGLANPGADSELIKRLEMLFQSGTEEPKPGIKLHELLKAEPTKDLELIDTTTKVAWPAILDEVVRMTGGAGRRLQLVHFLGDLDPKQEVLPPEFDIRLGGVAKPVQLRLPKKLPARNPANDIQTFDYDVLAEPPRDELKSIKVFGRVSRLPPPVEPKVPIVDPFIEPSSYWVRFPNERSAYAGRDWISKLPADVAKAADLPGHFLVALSGLLKESPFGAITTEGRDRINTLAQKVFERLLIESLGKGFGPAPALDAEWPMAWTIQSIHDKMAEDVRSKRAQIVPPAFPPTTALPFQTRRTAFRDTLKYALDKQHGSAAKRVAIRDGAELVIENAKDEARQNNPQDVPNVELLREVLHVLRSPEGGAALVTWLWLGHAAQSASFEVEAQGIDRVARQMPVYDRLTLDSLHSLWASLARALSTADENLINVVATQLKQAAKIDEPDLRFAGHSGVPEAMVRARKHLFATLYRRFDDILVAAVGEMAQGDAAFTAQLGDLRRRVARALEQAVMLLGHADATDVTPGTVLLEPDLALDTPQPLTFTVGNISDDGPAARFAGIGVLMRKAGNDQTWFCPTLGAIYRSNSKVPWFAGHVPWRIVRQAGLEGWVVSYAGLPITARPVLSKLTQGHEFESSDPEPKWQDLSEVRQIAHDLQINAKEIPGDWKKLLALAYGRTYEFAFFGQSHGGALPVEVSENGDPGAFVLPPKMDPPVNKQEEIYRINVRYLRRIPVGAPRLARFASQSDRSPSPLSLPPIPRDDPHPVFPLAEDLVGRNVLSETSPLDNPSAQEVGHLVLLAPGRLRGVRLVPNPQEWDSKSVSELTLAVTPPATSIGDYVLWRSADLDGPDKAGAARARKDIEDILFQYHEQLSVADFKKQSQKASIATPDDPAVGALAVEIRVLRPHEPLNLFKARPLLAVLMELPESGTRSEEMTGMARWQAPAMKLSLLARADGGFQANLFEGSRVHHKAGEQTVLQKGDPSKALGKLTPGNVLPGLELDCQSGCLYTIDIHCLARAAYFPDQDSTAARFRSRRLRFSETTKETREIARPWTIHPSWMVVSSSRLTVEVAKAFDKTIMEDGRRSLWKQLEARDLHGRELVISCESPKVPPDGPAAIEASWIYWLGKRAYLNRQLWSWSGRSHSREIHTVATTANVIQPDRIFALQGHMAEEERTGWRPLVNGDGQWFGDRADGDALEARGLLHPLGPPDRKGNNDHPAARGPLHRIDLEQDRRAQYWRYSARIDNRYIGLMAPARREEAGTAWVRAPWRRLLLKARPLAPMPKPRVKFILPLTEALSGNSTTGISSLLVALDEQWGEHAGIAEVLEARVVSVAKDAKDTMLEIGLDPIVSNTPPKLDGVSMKLEVRPSPIGLTFDTRIDRPRPASTCFEIKVTKELAEALKGIPDVMAKVQFRRALAASLVQTPEKLVDSLASDWTTPEWAIFNADSSQWWFEQTTPATAGAKALPLAAAKARPLVSIACSSLVLVAGSGPTGVELRNKTALRHILLPGSNLPDDSPLVRSVYLIVSETLVDADGGESEVLRYVSGPAPNGPTYGPRGGIGDIRRACVRLMEVESHRGADQLYTLPTPAKTTGDPAAHPLWNQLFPSDDAAEQIASERDDAIARIRRISAPIRAK